MGLDGHRAVRPPEPPFGCPNGGSAVRNDYHAAQMLQLQMLQMQRMGQLMTQFAQTQQQIWDMGSRSVPPPAQAQLVRPSTLPGTTVRGGANFTSPRCPQRNEGVAKR
jgi:hypothetical protein